MKIDIKGLVSLWNGLPRFARAGLWIGTSAGLTAGLSFCLEQPELYKWYGVLNILLVAIKEGKDRKRAIKK